MSEAAEGLLAKPPLECDVVDQATIAETASDESLTPEKAACEPTRYEVPMSSALVYIDAALASHAATETRAAALAASDPLYERWPESLVIERRRLERIRRRMTGEQEPEPQPVPVAPIPVARAVKRDRARHIVRREPARIPA